MSDLVTRLRRWTHDANAVPAGDLMDEAAAEIDRLRLTDAEREAIQWASDTLCVGWGDLTPDDKDRCRTAADTLRRMLERAK